MPSREYDVVVHGATGFVGRLVAQYLRDHAPMDLHIGLSGRSDPRLRDVRDGLGGRATAWPLLVLDSKGDDDMRRLAASTRVVATTVGPYARLGLPLVEIRAPGDPGYGATKVMLGEAALALAGDVGLLPERHGVLTPVTGIGSELVRRLAAAGHRYEVVAD